MVRNYREAVCWLASHGNAVLVISAVNARLVGADNRNEALNYAAARALADDVARSKWFLITVESGRRLLRLNELGRSMHRRLVEREECTCPKTLKEVKR
jgi:phosphoserine phosphatase